MPKPIDPVAIAHRAIIRPIPLLTGALLLAFMMNASASADADRDRPAPPAEEKRLNRKVFREGLKKRGLTELLERHLLDFPPSGEVEALLMQREIRLAESADPNRPESQRRAAITEGNRILERLIESHANDERRYDWQYRLAYSLLYDEAEPLITSALYRGGDPNERSRLTALTEHALTVLNTLLAELEAEYNRIDALPIPQFEQLERTGYVERIDRLGPQAEYLMQWARLYDSLPRDEADRIRVRRLNQIRTYLTANPTLLEVPHDVSHVQVQVLVLAGLTERLLNDHTAARHHLGRALLVAERLSRKDRAAVRWAVTLAHVEGIRNERDDGQFDAALAGLERFRRATRADAKDDFGMSLVAALTERSILRSRAEQAERAGRTADARQYREDAWQALAQLANRCPDHRDEIYATVYQINGADADVNQMDSFDRMALIAGLLFDAGETAAPDDPRLAQVVEVGKGFLATVTGRGRTLTAEVLFNVAVAEFRRGRMVEAARWFLKVVRDCPTWEGSEQAAVYAVQLAADLYNDSSLRDHPEAQQLYRNALRALIEGFTDTAAAEYWRFYYAQLLDELGEHESAAEQYALVHKEHEHYVEGTFARVKCLASALQQHRTESTEDLLVLRRKGEEFFKAQRRFISLAGDVLGASPEPERAALLRKLRGQAKVLAAEVQVIPEMDRAVAALDTLRDFETTDSPKAGLLARVWRVRLLAYERLGRLEEAERAIPEFVAADPENAGPTLQKLYATLAADAERIERRNVSEASLQKAKVALLLAQQIVAWSDRYASDTPAAEHRAWAVQLAEAHLAAGQYAEAAKLFGKLRGPTAAEATTKQPDDLRVVLGYSETQYQLGDFAAALPGFAEVATQLPANDPIRWQALLRDLQCRTALNHPPHGIIKVIEQQKYLYPDLGNPEIAEELRKLQRENQRRIDGE